MQCNSYEHGQSAHECIKAIDTGYLSNTITTILATGNLHSILCERIESYKPPVVQWCQQNHDWIVTSWMKYPSEA